ncbi:uncharacterized protein LOC114530598 [Dendronephthya gigantea]|uniref:uncharacterized protein LOC114530598 n=1 Tax=Dendronephthya gigantea TaxID=151771 RepID=UPI0010695106|nr:uncharacterized protein LOC114530598 [Dendronephthya gigantea]
MNMLGDKVVVFLLYSLTTYCRVSSTEVPIITRDTYDLLQYPKCNGKSVEDFQCDGNSERVEGDDRKKTCQCKCKRGYLTYRDPQVEYDVLEGYKYKVGKRGCVWNGISREGCHNLQMEEKLMYNNNTKFSAPIILDLTEAGSIILTKEGLLIEGGSYCFDPYVRIPGKNQWEKVENIHFDLQRVTGRPDKYKLSWTLSGNQFIYAYQGLVMKLNFSVCSQQSLVYCMIAKVAGTYTGHSNCKHRTVNNRCCIFPFVYNGKVHNKCVSTSDMPGGTWCAVSLNPSVTTGNHKWREFCSTSTTTPSSLTTRPPSRHPPIIHSPPPMEKKTTPKQHIKTEPHPAQNSKLPKDIYAVTVTVTQTCGGSSKAVPTIVSGKRTGGSDSNTGLIVGIVCVVVFLVIVVALVAFCLRRRRSTRRNRKSRPKKSISREDLAESPYASFYSKGTPINTLNHLNHGYQQSIELTEDQAAAIVRRSYLKDSLNGVGNHHYDTVENGSRQGKGLSCPIYSMPEADYSLIMEQRQTKIDRNLPPVLPVFLSGRRVDPTRHLYSVLERDHDPFRNPEPTDNDSVFVEANPLYGTTTRYKMNQGMRVNEGGLAEANPLYGTITGFGRKKPPPPLPPRLYEDPLEIVPTRNDRPGLGEADI